MSGEKNLSLEELLTVIWVWQCELYPKLRDLQKEFEATASCPRQPEKHVETYRQLLNQFRFISADAIRTNKAAVSMLLCKSSEMVFFEQANPLLAEAANLKHFDASKLLKKPTRKARIEALRTIMALLSVDDAGNKLYTLTNVIDIMNKAVILRPSQV